MKITKAMFYRAAQPESFAAEAEGRKAVLVTARAILTVRSHDDFSSFINGKSADPMREKLIAAFPVPVDHAESFAGNIDLLLSNAQVTTENAMVAAAQKNRARSGKASVVGSELSTLMKGLRADLKHVAAQIVELHEAARGTPAPALLELRHNI